MNWPEFWAGFRIGFASLVTGVAICAIAFHRAFFGGVSDEADTK